MKQYPKEAIEAMADVVGHMLWLMETSGNDELEYEAEKMRREQAAAVRHRCMSTLADLNAEAAIRLHEAGYLQFDLYT